MSTSPPDTDDEPFVPSMGEVRQLVGAMRDMARSLNDLADRFTTEKAPGERRTSTTPRQEGDRRRG